MRICLFDLVANNADRKGGHCLLGADHRIYAIDNGLTFHVEPKLRTVIWDFGGEPIPREAIETIRRLLDEGIPAPVAELLDPEEQQALLAPGQGAGAPGPLPEGCERHALSLAAALMISEGGFALGSTARRPAPAARSRRHERRRNPAYGSRSRA